MYLIAGINKVVEYLKNVLIDGDNPHASMSEKNRELVRNHYYINAKTDFKPNILNLERQKATNEDLLKYAFVGAYFHISLQAYHGYHKHLKINYMNVGLKNLMLTNKPAHKLANIYSDLNIGSEFDYLMNQNNLDHTIDHLLN